MLKALHGLKDIHTVITNQRKIGGAAEASLLRLRSGEEYSNPVFTSLDLSNGQFVSIGFMTEDGENIIIHVNEISMIKGLQHKLICQLNNVEARHTLLEDTLRYLRRLCEINQGFVTPPFKEELTKLVSDISIEELRNIDIDLPIMIQENVYALEKRLFA